MNDEFKIKPNRIKKIEASLSEIEGSLNDTSRIVKFLRDKLNLINQGLKLEK